MAHNLASPSGERSLDSLYEACARDDTNAIAEFVRLYQPELASYARRHNADDPEGAADLATFDTVRRLADMRTLEEGAIRAYLFRCLKSRMIDEGRRSHLHQVSLDELPTELSTDGPESPVLDQLGFNEMLDLLTPAEREVVSHRFVDGYTSVETAERVGRSPDAVRRLQSNALARLRLALAVAVVIAALCAAAWMVARSPVTDNTDPIGDPTEQDRPGTDPAPTDDGDPTSAPAVPATTPAAERGPLAYSAETETAAPPTMGPPATDVTTEPVDDTETLDAADTELLPALAGGGQPVPLTTPPVTTSGTSQGANGRAITTTTPRRLTTTAPVTTSASTTIPTGPTASSTTEGTGSSTTTGAGTSTSTIASTTSSTSSSSTSSSTVPSTTSSPSTTAPPTTTTSEPSTSTTKPGNSNPPGNRGQGGPPTDDGRAGPVGRPDNDPGPRNPESGNNPGQGNQPEVSAGGIS